jgi:ubiquinone/menaquinone biosynthesis C-methylase UbiE
VIEKELANRLRTATKDQRRHLYNAVYDELFRRVPHHPQVLLKKGDCQSQRQVVMLQMGLLMRALKPDTTFLEIGPGDCSLSFEVAKHVKQVYAVDVSSEIATFTSVSSAPDNFELFISDGFRIPVPDSTVNIAYSNQLIEHLHPEDASEQIQNIWRALVPGGIYMCVTPWRSSGPHDISRHFDQVATGFHLKEYSIRELADVFRANGFSKVQVLFSISGNASPWLLPCFPFVWLESLFGRLPHRIEKVFAKPLLAVKLVARK